MIGRKALVTKDERVVRAEATVVEEFTEIEEIETMITAATITIVTVAAEKTAVTDLMSR